MRCVNWQIRYWFQWYLKRYKSHKSSSLRSGSMETDASQSHTGKRVSWYSTKYKLEADKFAEESKSISSAVKKFNVDCKRICEWQSAKAKLQAAHNRRKRLEGGGRKPFDFGREDKLLEWGHQCRSSGLGVSPSASYSWAKMQGKAPGISIFYCK